MTLCEVCAATAKTNNEQAATSENRGQTKLKPAGKSIGKRTPEGLWQTMPNCTTTAWRWRKSR